MTSKKKITIPPTASVKVVPGTSYVVIDGKHVAKFLTPTIRGVEPKVYYNVFLNGSKKPYTQLTAAEISELKPPYSNE